jgi:hypothetical protein
MTYSYYNIHYYTEPGEIGPLCTWLRVLQFWTEIKLVITNRTSPLCDFVITRSIPVQIVLHALSSISSIYFVVSQLKQFVKLWKQAWN